LDGHNKKREVLVPEESKCIIKIGMSSTSRATAIVTKLMVSPSVEGIIEGASIWRMTRHASAGELEKTVSLDEEVQGAIRAVKKAFTVMDEAV
jgi:hypothetical protein